MKIRINSITCFLVCLTFLAFVTSTIAAGVDKNTIGLWLLDEGKGVDVKDSTGNHNDGQIVGDATWVKGKFGTALECGEGKSVIVPYSATFNSTKQITVEAWVNFGDAGVAKDMVIARIEPGFSLQKFNIDVMEGWINIGGWKGVRDIAGGEVMKPNQWYHVAYIYDGSSLKIYVNGNLDRENAISGDIEIAEAPFTIGSYKGESYFWLGMVDEVCVSSVAKSQDEIKADMAGFSSVSAVTSGGKLASTWAQIKR
jgi:hypothetical protein